MQHPPHRSLSLPFLFLLLHFHEILVQVPLHYCRHPNTAILTTRQQRAREGRACKRVSEAGLLLYLSLTEAFHHK